MDRIKILFIGIIWILIVVLLLLSYAETQNIYLNFNKTNISFNEVEKFISEAQYKLEELNNTQDTLLAKEITDAINYTKILSYKLNIAAKESTFIHLAKTTEQFIYKWEKIAKLFMTGLRKKDSANIAAIAEIRFKLFNASLFNSVGQQQLNDFARMLKIRTLIFAILILALGGLTVLSIIIINLSKSQTEKVHLIQKLTSPTTNISQRSEIPLYVVSSIFIKECYRFLTQGEPEWMYAVTGIHFGYIYTLERILKIEANHQSISGVISNPNSVAEALLYLQEHGHCLHAVFHSHRFRGIPFPSTIDRALQTRLDAGNYPAIQAIFSEDGYVRFFSGIKEFEIVVYGKGVEKVYERVYKIIEVN